MTDREEIELAPTSELAHTDSVGGTIVDHERQMPLTGPQSGDEAIARGSTTCTFFGQLFLSRQPREAFCYAPTAPVYGPNLDRPITYPRVAKSAEGNAVIRSPGTATTFRAPVASCNVRFSVDVITSIEGRGGGFMSTRRNLGLVVSGILILTGCGAAPTKTTAPPTSHISALTVTRQMTPQFSTTSTTPPVLTQVPFIANRHGFALATLGQESAVLHTSDSGQSWQARYLAPTLFGLSMANNQAGWLTTCLQSGCQAATTLEATLNGGHSWNRIYHAPANTTLGTPDFVNATTGWMVESNHSTMKSVLLRSSDGGKTWTPAGSPSSLFPGSLGSALDFITTTTGWFLVGGEPGAGAQTKTLYQTTNGGRSWAKIAQSAILGSPSSGPGSLPIGGYVDRLDFVNSTLGHMALANGLIYRTRDSGTHWAPIWSKMFPPATVTVQSMEFSSSATGYILAQGGGQPGGTLWQTTDGGARWVALYPSTRPNGSVTFTTREVGAGLEMMGTTSTVLTTQNGGATWTVASQPPILLGSLQWGGNRTLWGVSVGVHGAIYRSRDMGRAFQKIALPRSYVAQSVSVAASNELIAVVSSTKNVEVMTRANGHWQALSLPFAPRQATEPAPQNIWAIGTSLKTTLALKNFQKHHNNPKTVKLYDIRHPLTPYLYHTVNGRTWTRYSLPAGSSGNSGFPMGLTFLSGQFGYFWNQGALYVTQNGGMTWTIETVPSSMGIQLVSFTSPADGWLTPGSGTPTYHTTNGGKSWSS